MDFKDMTVEELQRAMAAMQAEIAEKERQKGILVEEKECSLLDTNETNVAVDNKEMNVAVDYKENITEAMPLVVKKETKEIQIHSKPLNRKTLQKESFIQMTRPNFTRIQDALPEKSIAAPQSVVEPKDIFHPLPERTSFNFNPVIYSMNKRLSSSAILKTRPHSQNQTGQSIDRPTEYTAAMMASREALKKKAVKNEVCINQTLLYQGKDPNRDSYSGILLKNRLVDQETMKERMVNRQFVPLSLIRDKMVGPDIAGDWVTVGIIASTLSTLKSNSRNKRNEGKKPQETQFGVYQFFDLKDTSVNLLLSQECVTMMAKEEMGSVVALLNPTIMTPNESKKSLGLLLDQTGKWMKMGDAKDFAVCPAKTDDGENCGAYINTSKQEFCFYHEKSQILQRPKKRRQELISGNAMLFNYDATLKNTTEMAAKCQKIEPATYSIGTHGILTVGKSLEITDPCNNDSDKNPALLKELLMQCDAGGKKLRTSRNITWSPEKMQKATDIWSHDTLRKIGFHPYTGKDYIKKRLLTDSCTEKRIVLEDEDNFGNEKLTAFEERLRTKFAKQKS